MFAIVRSSWLEMIYPDGDLRIGRGNRGSLLVLRKLKG
ncbi:MAG: PAP/fibrillin family protein [Cyanobacteria bacterium J06626_4]